MPRQAARHAQILVPSGTVYFREAADVRGGRYFDSLPSSYDGTRLYYSVSRDEAFAPATRSDIILTLYYYMTTCYNVAPVADREVKLSEFSDWNQNYYDGCSVGVDGNVAVLRPTENEFEAAWK